MKRAILILACLAASGCAARAPDIPVAYDPSQPVVAVAQLLAEAEAAQNDPKRLGVALAALDSMGARAAPDTVDPVPVWRSKARMPRTQPFRGRVLGPAYKAGMIDPGKSVRLPQLFDGGRAARVAVATPVLTGLDFTVLDREAKPVCPPGKARNRQCTWTPLFSGRFEIVLSNPSSNAAGYYLVID
ncbi:hypothetical protein [Novosphingobium sp. AAP83]|uniref:hypothetical protein n=1 Tax=Novosphingobium sp. AAP83 TaxID=1523425 RepID=UPI0006B9F0E0|nr:hypothetical protein [Novosphingobium sp. AAP83]